jgi:two-component system phosphate regulon sensor histidine kinase PhoR
MRFCQSIGLCLPSAVSVLSGTAAAAAVFLKWPLPLLSGLAVATAVSGAVALIAAVQMLRRLSDFTALCKGGPQADAAPAELKRRLEENDRELEKLWQQNSDLSLQVKLSMQSGDGVEAILDTICDAVLVTDSMDRIVLSNPSAQALLNFTPEKNQSLTALACHPLSELVKKVRCSRTRHVRHELELEKDGQPVSMEAVLSSQEDESGRVVQVVTVLHDITRQKEISRMKNDFVSHVSHELKTPLASINAYAEMLVDGEAQDEETLKQFCTVIQGQAQRLSRLIEDILNISRIESGLIKVSRDNHSLAMVIRDAAAMITSYAQEKHITVTAPAPILYDQVYIDRDMISQVVINLLSNAVKYTPAGGQVTIASELNEVDGRITVTVTDTGVGIPAEAVDHVFDKFYRVEANNKYAKGTGLGLNLVKQIVETVHGGKVFVNSTPGRGSTFGFVLPLSKETAAAV